MPLLTDVSIHFYLSLFEPLNQQVCFAEETHCNAILKFVKDFIGDYNMLFLQLEQLPSNDDALVVDLMAEKFVISSTDLLASTSH